VLGFDDEMSADHHWGPRVMLFLREDDHRSQAEVLQDALAHHLPTEFRGYPTNFTQPDPEDNGVQLLRAIERGPVVHRVSSHTVPGFFSEYLGFDVDGPLDPADWLTFPEQKLRTIAVDSIYHDELGLGSVCSRFAYYPHDVWLYLLAAGWARIGQEDHLMGRAGLVGDEIGSALIGSRLARDIMRLCFLMERVYAPYAKWFGTAFKQLGCAATLWPILQQALRAETWQIRERYLVEAYEHIAVMHNALRLTEPVPGNAVLFHGRPFRVIGLNGFTQALLNQIRDPAVKQIAQRSPIGAIDQFSDSTDLVSDPFWRPVLRQLYQSRSS
jgi:hypothetical protein